MNCSVCRKPLRKDNTIGTCRAHRGSSAERRAYENKWKAANKEHHLQTLKDWRKDNRVKYNTWFDKRRKNDDSFRLAGVIRNAIRHAVKRNGNTKYIPCSIKEFKEHLQSKFKSKMTWSNYGKWEIDHIRPLSSFDLTIPKEMAKACALKNVQPLWRDENLAKRSTEYISKSAGLRNAYSLDDVR